MEYLDLAIIGSFLTLSFLEIVLGIDNLIFISLCVSGLPKEYAQKARVIGLSLALIMRIGLLFALSWVLSLTEPVISIFDKSFSGKDILLIVGGLFLVYKATSSIHEEVTHEAEVTLGKSARNGFFFAIAQIVLIDLIFSLDSVITAVGLTQNIPVIVAAMTVAMVVMLFASNAVSNFIEKYPTMKILALAFIMLVGGFLFAEGCGFEVPKGYIYFAMFFSLGVETVNILLRNKMDTRKTKKGITPITLETVEKSKAKVAKSAKAASKAKAKKK